MHILGPQVILKAYLPLHSSVPFSNVSKMAIMFILVILHFTSATPQPTISLINSTLHSLSIIWSMTSPQYVTSYSVFWWTESGETGRSVALNDTEFVIEDLLSNTAYLVVVQASGPLGNVNSTRMDFYTSPNEVQGNLT